MTCMTCAYSREDPERYDQLLCIVDGSPSAVDPSETCESYKCTGTDQLIDSLLQSLMEALDAHHHPHVTAIVTPSSAELVEGFRSVINNNLRD
jgi:hypothetical protein